LLEAFALLRQAVPEAHLVLAWSGIGDAAPVRRVLARTGLAGHVTVLGRVPPAAVLSACDVLALPYRTSMGQAAFPALVLEAMYLGVPLATTDLPLLRELVEPGRTAVLAAPGDVASLAAALRHLLTQPRLRAGMAAAQQQVMAERLDPRLVATQYAQLYTAILARKARVLRQAGHRPQLRDAAVRRR
jgi:glycosyltransferase involved in cell wall biosynthesis